MAANRKATKPLIEAKLYPGVGAASPITRKRLYPPESFLSGQYAVYLVKAPAGYGKSTLMSQAYECMAEQNIDSAWLSVDPDDNDPTRFLQYLIAAIERVLPDLLDTSLTQTNADLSSIKSVLETLAQNLGNLQSQLAIFLDDIQFIESSDVLGIVDWLISYAPPQCQFVLGSREEPNLHLGKLRVRRRLLEVDISQMAFSLEEAREFLNVRLSPPLAESDIASLHQRTEGWPAGLEMAVLALENETERSQLIETFAGDDQSVVDYLGEVVLTSLDDDVRRFVYQVAQFPRINARLAEQVTGHKDAAALLQQIRARNMFLIPLDRQGEWCRFHHFVGQYLRDRCRLEAPELAAQALHDGAQWLYDQGYIEEAINLALQAEAWQLAAGWVAENAISFTHQKGYLQTFLGWMNALPRKWLDQYPQIRSGYAYALTFYPNRKGVVAELQHLRDYRQRQQSAKKPDQTIIDRIDCSIEHLEALYAALCDEGLRVLELAQAWQQRWPEADHNLRGDIANMLAYGYKTSGDIDAGLAACEQARQHGEQAEYYFIITWSYILRSYLLMKRGDYPQARKSAEQALQTVQQYMGGHRTMASLCHAVLGYLAHESGDFKALEKHVAETEHVSDDFGQADFIILRYSAQARLQFHQGDTENALETLRHGQSVGLTHDLERSTTSLAAEEIVWLCRLGRIDEAREVAQRFAIPTRNDSDAEPSRMQVDKGYRTGTRIRLADAPQEVANVLDSGIRYCEQRGFQHRRVDLLLIQSAAHKQAGNSELAAASLKQALLIGCQYGYYQIYLDEAHALADLIMQLKLENKDEAVAKPLLLRLQKALEQASRADGKTVVGEGLVEKLSKREQQILKRLDSELSNREIAEAIFVSEGTLKWHLHNIYGKLGVKNRSGALMRARELSYL